MAATNGRPAQFKIIMIGDSGVGKTSLASVFVEGRNGFPQTYITTHEKEIYTKRFRIGRCDIILKIWDLSGADSFRTITTYYYTNADALMLCYSVGSQKSWINVDNWIENAKLYFGPEEFADLPKLIVGTRMDLKNKVVDEEKGLEKSFNVPNTEFCLTSAKNNVGVHEAFENLVDRILRKRLPETNSLIDGKQRSSSTQSNSREWKCRIL